MMIEFAMFVPFKVSFKISAGCKVGGWFGEHAVLNLVSLN